jgi:hypothetical protein
MSPGRKKKWNRVARINEDQHDEKTASDGCEKHIVKIGNIQQLFLNCCSSCNSKHRAAQIFGSPSNPWVLTFREFCSGTAANAKGAKT